ncbi:hypothetical protein ACF07B_30445 [Streptomyces sp. NPDC015532]|uniref:hypothetical protein n=1 Tax=Streptomyces sp. NPDC015532 TaxID=3364960 RepID=UPI0036FBA6B7
MGFAGRVCIHSTGDAPADQGTATLEPFPGGDFDRDHPVLWHHVRDADPPPTVSRGCATASSSPT